MLTFLGRVPQMFHAIVRAFDFAELTRNRFTYRSRQPIVQRFFEFVHGRIFAPLALAQDRFVIAAGHGGFQIDPGAMHCTGGAACFFRVKFAKILSLALEFGRKAMTLLRIFLKQRFELRIFHGVSGFLETLLAVLQSLDQTIDR